MYYLIPSFLQIVVEEFLEDINNVLNSGEVSYLTLQSDMTALQHFSTSCVDSYACTKCSCTVPYGSSVHTVCMHNAVFLKYTCTYMYMYVHTYILRPALQYVCISMATALPPPSLPPSFRCPTCSQPTSMNRLLHRCGPRQRSMASPKETGMPSLPTLSVWSRTSCILCCA